MSHYILKAFWPVLFALYLCYPKLITRSAIAYNHIFPPACFLSCPWVQHQPPRAQPTLHRVQDPTPVPRPSAPVPAPLGGWWQGQQPGPVPAQPEKQGSWGHQDSRSIRHLSGDKGKSSPGWNGWAKIFLRTKGSQIFQRMCGPPELIVMTGHI